MPRKYKKEIVLNGRFVSVPASESEYPYCPKCQKHVTHPFYNSCTTCETPVLYSNGMQYPIPKEEIARREKQHKRDEKYQNASRLGKLWIGFGEFADELLEHK